MTQYEKNFSCGTLQYTMRPDRLSYVAASRGRLEVNGVCMEERDRAAIKDVAVVVLTALIDVDVVLVDVSA